MRRTILSCLICVGIGFLLTWLCIHLSVGVWIFIAWAAGYWLCINMTCWPVWSDEDRFPVHVMVCFTYIPAVFVSFIFFMRIYLPAVYR